jgi:arylsulfatase A-like enzyme
VRTMPGRPGSYIPPDHPERSGMGGRSRRSRRSKRSRRYRRAGGPEPDEEPSGVIIPGSQPQPQPQPTHYLPRLGALAFPGLTAAAAAAQLLMEQQRRNGR